jgi:streptomycin 6-kinase
LEKYPFDKKLLHGDFGTHNFIQEDGKLVGVIDPMPVIGDYLYDLLFAVVSNVDILSSVSLEDLYNLVNEPPEKIKAMLTIVLYCRISRCLKYHPEDIEIYMEYWNKLTQEY